MRNNETGEYELVMDNRQLLSGFFIVALLFGVAFAMGYIVGRNASPGQKVQAESGHTGAFDQRRPEIVTPAPAPVEQPRTETPAPPTPAASPETQPTAASDTAAVQTAAVKSEEPAAAPAEASELAPGNYWQVVAVSQPVAESTRKVLREKNFSVTLSPGTKNLTRVIVGPYADRESLGKAKAELENAGFHPILLKR